MREENNNGLHCLFRMTTAFERSVHCIASHFIIHPSQTIYLVHRQVSFALTSFIPIVAVGKGIILTRYPTGFFTFIVSWSP